MDKIPLKVICTSQNTYWLNDMLFVYIKECLYGSTDCLQNLYAYSTVIAVITMIVCLFLHIDLYD